MSTYRTEAEIVAECNELAETFYAMQGCRNVPGFKYYEAHHPQELMVWELACAAYDHIEGTDVQGALDNMEPEDA